MLPGGRKIKREIRVSLSPSLSPGSPAMSLQRFWLTVIVGACLMAAPSAAAQPLSHQIEYGADYYAEDWPPERVEIDARLMEQAKFRTARLVDTNWERLEPQEGRYDFAWLDRVIEILNRHGIRTVLSTSSYVPPAWLIEEHPEFYLVNEAGVRRRWGGMGYMCLNNPLYLQYVKKLVTALASHYGRHPGVIGWQIDNEMGGWGFACYDADYCVPKFRQYLKKKFGTLDELNRRLVTVSYGHAYSSWDQIPLRWSVAEDAHQAPLLLETQRFFSANITEFMAFQASLLRQYTSGQFITHNGPSRQGNGFDFAKPLDFLCDDSYPRVGEYIAPAFGTDVMRGFNRGKPFLLLEHRSGSFGGYTLGDATPPPGLSRLWAWQTLAHGADGVLFFRWRMSNGGSEQYWQGLLNYDGSPGRAFPEVARMGVELEKVGSEFVHAETPASVAEVMSYDSHWALQIGDDKFPYFDLLKAFSSSFHHWGLNVDFIEPTGDLGRYKVVAAPTLHVVDPAIVENLEKFVGNGGILILTARSGFKNQDNLATEVPPGLLERMAKVWVRDYTLLEQPSERLWFGFPSEQGAYQPSPDNRIKSVSPDWPGEYKAKGWADILDPDGARPLFRYQKDYYAGRAAVTIADYGKGKVIYVGTMLEPRFYIDLARRACEWAKVDLGPEIPEGTDFALRQENQRSFRFLLNFGECPKTVRLPGEYRDLLSGKVFTGQVTVPRLDLCVLVQNESKPSKVR
jgi:beta-galactosidase